MPRGYQLVDPSLNYPEVMLDEDQEVRVLSYLIEHLGDITVVPEGLQFEVLAVQWHYHGPHGPQIGFYPLEEGSDPKSLGHLVLRLSDELRAYAFEVGLDRLLELSAEQPITWADVLERTRLEQDG